MVPAVPEFKFVDHLRLVFFETKFLPVANFVGDDNSDDDDESSIEVVPEKV
uniref:Bm11669 n=1 Tax=Brugia malayi TaxID=6279 RepID=A0A1I9G9T6_BRUMA|nr:Bm11669 [Brugia malayi]